MTWRRRFADNVAAIALAVSLVGAGLTGSVIVRNQRAQQELLRRSQQADVARDAAVTKAVEQIRVKIAGELARHDRAVADAISRLRFEVRTIEGRTTVIVRTAAPSPAPRPRASATPCTGPPGQCKR